MHILLFYLRSRALQKPSANIALSSMHQHHNSFYILVLLCAHVVLEELHGLQGSRQYCNYIELEFFFFSKKIW